MSINRVTISGNLTREPELRQTPSGMAVLTIGVAVNDRVKNKQTGEWEDYANFVDVVFFGKRAASLANMLHKGIRVAIDGKLRYSQWEKDGQRRSKLEVVGDELVLMARESASDVQQYGGAAVYAQQRQAARQSAPSQAYDVQPSVYDHDIPF